LNVGSTRLVSVREGPNVGQGFYAIRVNEKIARWIIDRFASEPAKENPDFFDNTPLNATNFWGVYSSHPSLWAGYKF
jgi:hypothetical protein